MNLRTILLLSLGAVSMMACGSDDSEGSAAGTGGGTSVTTTSAATSGSGGAGGEASAATGTGGAGGSGGAGGAAPAAPEAPDMKSVMKMGGALHVTWVNVAMNGDKVHLFRNENGGAFEEAYVLTGAATSQHDTAASDSSLTYCYHAQCERDGLLSVDSDEVCGTP